jgi:hypothetical protein
MKTVAHRGVTYRSMVALHRACAVKSVTYQHFMNRLRAGWETEEALTTPGTTNAITYKGRTYASLRAIHRAHAASSVRFSTFRDRVVNRGWSISKGLSIERASPKERKFVVDGVCYESLAELARAAGIGYSAAAHRCYRGFSDHEIFHGRPRKPRASTASAKDTKPVIAASDRRCRPVLINGVHYDSLSAAHNALKPSMDLRCVRARLRQGWTLEQAFEVVPRKDGRKLFAKFSVCIGDSSMSVAEASAHYGVPARTIRSRLHQGASGEQAVGLSAMTSIASQKARKAKKSASRHKRAETRYTVDGVEYPSIAALASAFGVPYPLVRSRIRTFGWDAKRAVTESPCKSVVVSGVSYRSAASAWKAIGKTSRASFDGRYREGYSLEQCLGLAAISGRHRWEVNGKTYKTLSEVAQDHGMSLSVLHRRLSWMDLEDALRYEDDSKGRYTLSRCRQNKRLAKSRATIYFVRVTTSEGVLQKVGITRQSIAARFHNNRYNVIATYWGSLQSVLTIERALLQRFSTHLYAAPKSFDGRTETLLLLPDEEALVSDELQQLAVRHRCSPGVHVNRRRPRATRRKRGATAAASLQPE